jgi:hypothetical protein
MPEYWVIVRRNQSELLALLTAAFRGRRGFTVIGDRREPSTKARHRDRRLKPNEWNNDDFFVAERVSLFD